MISTLIVDTAKSVYRHRISCNPVGFLQGAPCREITTRHLCTSVCYGGSTAGLVLTSAAQWMISSVVLLRFAHEAGLLVVLACGLTATLVLLRRMASIEPVQALRAE
jgi:hypothetical protein